MVGSPFKSKTSASPLGFFKKGGSNKARPIFGRKPKSILGTPLGSAGSIGGSKPKRGFGKLTVDVARRGGGFASKKAKEFNEKRKELKDDRTDIQKEIDDTLVNLEDIEDDEEQQIQIVQQTARDPQRAQKRVQKIRKEADKKAEKERKDLEKERKEDKKVSEQLKANEDRINQIALILKPSAFKV